MGRAFPAPVKRALLVMRLSIIILFSLLATQASAWTPSDAALDIPQEVDVEQRIQPDPNNCNVYYYLKVPLTCGEGNAFNKGSLRCDSLENVAKFDPSCGGEGGSNSQGGSASSSRGGSGGSSSRGSGDSSRGGSGVSSNRGSGGSSNGEGQFSSRGGSPNSSRGGSQGSSRGSSPSSSRGGSPSSSRGENQNSSRGGSSSSSRGASP